MKKMIFFLILSAILSLTGKSQHPYTITRLDSTIYKIFEAIPTDDGGFIIAGNNFDSDSNKFFFIAKINNAGKTIWKKNYTGSMYYISSLLQESDGNYFIAMDGENHKGLLLETNNAGDSIWSWTSSSFNGRSRLGPIRELPDGSFIVAENVYWTDYAYPPVESNYYHLDSDGSVILKFSASHIETQDIEVISENEFISAEIFYDGIVKYNTDGEIINNDTCNDVESNYYGQWAISRLNEHRFFASGHIYTSEFPYIERGLISEFDENGNFAYCTMDTSIVYFEGILTAKLNHLVYHGVSNQGIVIGEFSPPDQFFPGLVVDSVSSWDYTLAISGEYICLFSIVDPFPNERAVLVKIPLDAIVTNIKEPENCSVKVYPNPAKDYVIFESPEANIKDKVLTIADVFGEKVKSLIIKNGPTVWDTHQIKAGVYFYTIESEKSRSGGKIIIIR